MKKFQRLGFYLNDKDLNIMNDICQKTNLNKKGIETPTCERNFRRYADNFKRTHYDEWVLAREGQKALRDKVLMYIERDVSQLEVGDVLVADGHRLAVQCLNPFTGKPCRATLIGYLDWKSTMLVGYEIMLEEDTQAITSALRALPSSADFTPSDQSDC